MEHHEHEGPVTMLCLIVRLACVLCSMSMRWCKCLDVWLHRMSLADGLDYQIILLLDTMGYRRALAAG